MKLLTACVIALLTSSNLSAQNDRDTLTSAQLPIYPPMAMVARVEGIVLLNATISPTGDVVSVEVVSGNPLLAHMCLDNVKTWKVRWLVGTPKQTITRQVRFVFRLLHAVDNRELPLRVTVVGIDRVDIEAAVFSTPIDD